MQLSDGTIQNTLFTGDNLFILHGMNSESVDLIYLDPPFNSKRMYSGVVGSKSANVSFKDMWVWSDINEAYLERLADKYQPLVLYIKAIQELHSKPMMAYIVYMTQRIIEMHRILKDTGSFYLHCDPTASHYLKAILDDIFGKDNFRNEIIWSYKKWTNSAKHFQRNGCTLEFNVKDLEVDHIVPKSKGGGDYYENYQLLCGSCNRIKGARPMDYLRMKIEAIRIKLKDKLQFGE